jgi:hypothetical protein
MSQQSYTHRAMSASARSAATGRARRVLLIHANPFQRVTPVPAYGLERVRTAAEEAGAEVELLDPYLVSEDPIGAAREAVARFRPDLIGLGIRIIDDCIVVDRLEGDEPIDVSFLLPEIRELRDTLAEAAPEAMLVAGGAGFSACPQECLEYLDVEYGVVGAGEAAMAALVTATSECQAPGLVRKGQTDGIAAYHLGFSGPTRREPLYAPANSFPVRTRIGCAMQCVSCTAANLGRQHANGDLGVSITVDSAADSLLETAQKPFRRRHLDALVALLGEKGVSADLGLIFGLPGETEETIAETIGFVRSLPESIEVVYSAGARVDPHTPLAAIARREPERLVGADDPSFLTPVVYSSPLPPRELAARLDKELRDLPNVSRVGVAYRTGLTTLSDAYRAALSQNGKHNWDEILERAADDDTQRKPAETIAACLQVALWHGRYDLASAAARRLLREDVPAEMSRAQLRFAHLAYGGLALADRAKSALRR